MRVLVTGAGGFLGRRSLAPLRAGGAEVHAVLSPRAAAGHAAPPEGILHRADLMDPAAVDFLVDAVRPTHLLHFAWIATPGEYWNSPDNHRWLAASKHLLRAFHRGGGTRVVMAGSCAEYDWGRAGVCHERTT
ncbi:MAG TPA: NAD-dependent epimerase/dehydratase family protein, partial [Acetobacteraceae bacterium]|nr:NAD-dependent epimerase/dehydratase family protein [Acetobacteraceae bacterium]